MGERDGLKPAAARGLSIYAEIAEEVEKVFGLGSVGLGDGESGSQTDEARACFVRESIYLVVKCRLESAGNPTEDARAAKSRETRKVREELADLLGVDVNEVFRLHHHAAGLRAKDADFREKSGIAGRVLDEKFGYGL